MGSSWGGNEGTRPRQDGGGRERTGRAACFDGDSQYGLTDPTDARQCTPEPLRRRRSHHVSIGLILSPAVHTTLYNAETDGHMCERDVSGGQEDVIDDTRDAPEGERDQRRATG